MPGSFCHYLPHIVPQLVAFVLVQRSVASLFKNRPSPQSQDLAYRAIHHHLVLVYFCSIMEVLPDRGSLG